MKYNQLKDGHCYAIKLFGTERIVVLEGVADHRDKKEKPRIIWYVKELGTNKRYSLFTARKFLYELTSPANSQEDTAEVFVDREHGPETDTQGVTNVVASKWEENPAEETDPPFYNLVWRHTKPLTPEEGEQPKPNKEPNLDEGCETNT